MQRSPALPSHTQPLPRPPSAYRTILAPLPTCPTLPPIRPACKLSLTIASAAAAAANLSFCLERSRKYLSASGRILKILRIISSFGSAWTAILLSSFAFFIVPKLRESMIDFDLRVLGSAAKMFVVWLAEAKDGGAESRFKRAAASCWRRAVAVAIDSEVRMRLSEDSK